MKSLQINDNSILHGLNILIYEDGNFKLVDTKNNEINNFVDKNGFTIYYLNKDGVAKYIFKHDIAKQYILDGDGDCVIYKDNNYRNTNINNLKKCSFEEYKMHQINLSMKYEEEKKIKKNKSKRVSNAVDKALYSEGDKFYQIRLPDGTKTKLKKNVSIEEKLSIVNKLIKEWYDIIVENWNGRAVRNFLDYLSNYLVWHKDEDETRTRNGEILSKRKLNRLDGLERDDNIVYFEESDDEREKYY